ncbi:MAG TPA: hypothetical protein VGB17_08860 [Pyrinomonadaceae bacterium]|jgi:hypothetical protein
MPINWLEQETSVHQDHVIAHVIGATALGHFVLDETAYILLDIGFIWKLYLDCEMGLLPQSLAISELEAGAEVKEQLKAEIDRLHEAATDAHSLAYFAPAPAGCLISEVFIYAQGERRRVLIKGEEASLMVEASLATREISIYTAEPDAV